MMRFVLAAAILMSASVFAADWNIVHKNAETPAKELGEYLTKATGTPHKIWKDGEFKGNQAFYVGPTAFALKHGFDPQKFKPDGWAYKSVGANVVLIGHPHDGTQNAVYSFLENELGIRWYTFESIHIPKTKSPDFSKLDKQGVPAFTMRAIYSKARYLRDMKDMYTFLRRNKWNYYSSIHTPAMDRPQCHTLYSYVDPDKYFKSHPEYFSMDKNGKRFHGKNRGGGQLCFTNPEIADVAAKHLEEYIISDRKKLPKEKWPLLYDMTQLDSTTFMCMCANCQELSKREGSDSALILTFINKVAKKIAKKYPDVLIRTFAYVSTEKVPRTIRPEKNVIIQICDLYGKSDCYRPLSHPNNAEQLKLFESWRATGARLALWDYWNMTDEDVSVYFDPLRVETMVDAIADDIRYFKKIGVEDYFAEAETSFVRHTSNFYDLQFWLALKLLDDPTQNEHKLIAEFMKNHYGAAAVPMTKFLNYVREAVKNEKANLYYIVNPVRMYQTPEFLKQCYSMLKEAQNTLPPNSPCRVRVDKEMIPVVSVMITNKTPGFSLKQLTEEYKQCRLAVINAYAHPSRKKALLKQLKDDLVKMTIVLDIPAKFADVPAHKLKQFAWPVFFDAYGYKCLTDDPDSVTKKVMTSSNQGKEGRQHILKPQSGGLYPTSVGLYDPTTGKNLQIHIKDIPTDEKYHWYRIGEYNFGKQTFLWAWFWLKRANLRSVWVSDDGLDNINLWEVWVSVKITGPAYVKGSTKQNEVMLERIVLVKK